MTPADETPANPISQPVGAMTTAKGSAKPQAEREGVAPSSPSQRRRRKARPRPAPERSIKSIFSSQKKLLREFRKVQKEIRKGRRGGRREGAGAPYGNKNRSRTPPEIIAFLKEKLRPAPWPADLEKKMQNPLGFWAFLLHMIKEAWLRNPLDARLVGALNNPLRLMADLKNWVEKAPIIMEQKVMKIDLSKVPPEEQVTVARALKILRKGIPVQ